jgi:tetratricopeptide (TPR) repeat protein
MWRFVRIAGLALIFSLASIPTYAQRLHSGGTVGSSWRYAPPPKPPHFHRGPPSGIVGGFFPGPFLPFFPGYGFGYGYGYGYGAPLGMMGPYGPGPYFPASSTFFNSPIALVGAGTVLRNDLSRARTPQTDPTYAAELITLGDRLFRAGNLSRAVDRYEQAIRAEPGKAIARVRLAQIAIARGRFSDAAEKLREAETVEPGWISRAPDIQGLYSEPADFARQLARLEDHLQTHPNDRDAWLVLGAELFLSGRTRRAADIFLRLSDRREDPTLAAFLDATRPRMVDQQN